MRADEQWRHDDATVTEAPVDVAATWLRDQRATSMVGPVTWRPDDDFGVPVDGVEHATATGRPWHPPWYAEQLRAAGAEPG